MTTTKRILPAALLAIVACVQPADAPWLTMPTPEQHAASFFPATSTTMHGACACDDCHTDPNTFRVFDCLHCHEGAHADSTALATVHAAVAGYEWSSAACYRCHKDGIGVNHAPIFPIAAGSVHASVACTQCHVQPGDRTVLGCAGCHPHESATVATLHAGVVGYAFDSTLCVRCHADSQVNPMSAHLPFRITTGKHTGTPGGQCLRCHATMRTDKPFGANFNVFTCVDCHNKANIDSIHQGRSGYAYTTDACYRCHPSGVGGN